MESFLVKTKVIIFLQLLGRLWITVKIFLISDAIFIALGILFGMY